MACDAFARRRIHTTDMTLRPSSFAIDVPDSLLAGMRRGEHAAFEQVYRWFERPVFTLALRICGEREQAADVLQDTMLKVIARIGEFRGNRTGRAGAAHVDDSPFWGWLRQIAVNEALMALRRRRRDEMEPTDDLEANFALADDSTPPPPAAADAACLQRALEALPANTRTVLWLYHAEGYTHDEIAALMQRTPSFSKSQLARGTRRLRELLEPTALPLREVVHG
jgi:RNA polymerase sigma factor (sigma-70 family)